MPLKREQDMSNTIPDRISVASLWTEDVPATVHFYSEVLGLQLCPCQGFHMDPPHFDISGAYLAILKGKMNFAQESETFPVVALAVEDLDSAVERLKAHQVGLLMNIQEDESSRWAFFRDPGDNLIELAFWK